VSTRSLVNDEKYGNDFLEYRVRYNSRSMESPEFFLTVWIFFLISKLFLNEAT
jgi:hypothetical protein